MNRPHRLFLAWIAPLVLAGFVVGAARQGEPKPADTKAPEAPPDPLPRLRTIARMMVNIETRHRVQAYELDALVRYCDKNRFDSQLRLAIRTAHAEQEDYAARMLVFERDLGSELYAQMRAAMDAGPGTAPKLRDIIPEPPPPPEPLQHEIDAQAAKDLEEKQAAGEEEGGGG